MVSQFIWRTTRSRKVENSVGLYEKRNKEIVKKNSEYKVCLVSFKDYSIRHQDNSNKSFQSQYLYLIDCTFFSQSALITCIYATSHISTEKSS